VAPISDEYAYELFPVASDAIHRVVPFDFAVWRATMRNSSSGTNGTDVRVWRLQLVVDVPADRSQQLHATAYVNDIATAEVVLSRELPFEPNDARTLDGAAGMLTAAPRPPTAGPTLKGDEPGIVVLDAPGHPLSMNDVAVELLATSHDVGDGIRLTPDDLARLERIRNSVGIRDDRAICALRASTGCWVVTHVTPMTPAGDALILRPSRRTLVTTGLASCS
jgi:hypothetical protein